MTSRPTDLVAAALEANARGESSKAVTFAHLATAQQLKLGNIIEYLNSDRTAWNTEDDALVRAYLGLADASASTATDADVSDRPADASASTATDASDIDFSAVHS